MSDLQIRTLKIMFTLFDVLCALELKIKSVDHIKQSFLFARLGLIIINNLDYFYDDF